MEKLCVSLNILKDYVDYQLECCNAEIERFKKSEDFFSEKVDREWTRTSIRRNCLWEIKIQVDEMLYKNVENV